MYSRSKIKQNTPIHSSRNYRREMKLVLTNMIYCLLLFDTLKFSLGVRLHGGGSLPNSKFVNVSPECQPPTMRF